MVSHYSALKDYHFCNLYGMTSIPNIIMKYIIVTIYGNYYISDSILSYLYKYPYQYICIYAIK